MTIRRGFHSLAALFMLLALIAPSSGAAQGPFSIRIDELTDSNYPFLEARVSVSDSRGLPVSDIAQAAFAVTLDGTAVVIDHVEPAASQPLAVAILINNSSRMWTKADPTPLQRSLDAGTAILGRLSTGDQAAVIKYSETPATVLALTPNLDTAALAVESIKPEAYRTAMFDAVVEGVNALKGFGGRKMIVLIGDGGDSQVGPVDIEAAIQAAQSASIPVFAIGFGTDIRAQQLERIATSTGGVSRLEPTEFELQTQVDEDLLKLREQYAIRLIAPMPADNAEHDFELTVTHGGAKAEASAQFQATAGTIPISLPGFSAGQVIGGIVRFAPTIDWRAPLRSLELTIDGTVAATSTTPPYELEWNSTVTPALSGPHEFVFTAVDLAGNGGKLELEFVVQQPITIVLKDLTAGASVGQAVPVSAEITTLPGVIVERVEFKVDDTLITTLTSPPYEATIDFGAMPPGQQRVSVTAYDTQGLYPTTAAVPVGAGGVDAWVFVVIAVALAALVIPLALRSRRRAGAGQAVPKVAGSARRGAAGRGKAFLHETDGLNPGRVWPLGRSQVRLGRNSGENDILLKGLKASRRHALITNQSGQYFIQSMRPDNPARVNGAPVNQPVALQQGDVIELGETTLRFEM